MPKSHPSEEQILQMLQEWDAGGKPADPWRRYGISETTPCRWKWTYGGLHVGEAKRPSVLEEQYRLRRVMAD